MKRKPRADEKLGYFVLFLILVLGAYLSVAFFYGPSWINGSDSYIYITNARMLASGQTIAFQPPIDNDVKFLLFAGIESFYLLFGYGTLSSALFGVLCFLGTIVVIYLIGRKIHSANAGLLAAFLYAIFPLVVTQSSIVGDDVPLAFLISGAALFAVYASDKGRYSKLYYALSGFVAAISYLVVAEGAIGTLFIIAFLGIAALTERSRKNTEGVLLCIAGIGLALLVILVLALLVYGNPLHIFETVNADLGPTALTSGFLTYASYMFPSGLAQASFLTGFFLVPSQAGFSAMLSYIDRYDYSTMAFGYFGFAFVLSVIYFAVKREKRAIMPLVWFSVIFLYLGFGSQSLLKYLPLTSIERYLIVLCPAVVLAIGIALADVMKAIRNETRAVRTSAYVIIAYVLFSMAAISYFSIEYIQYSQYMAILPLVQIGGYVNSLGTGSVIIGPIDAPWYTYTNYSHTMLFDGYVADGSNCNAVMNFTLNQSDYLVGLRDGNYSSCGFSIAFNPSPDAALANYTLMSRWETVIYFYDMAVYKHG